MPDTNDRIAATAERCRLSRSAVQALADALAASHGGAAQWNHPELGGMGQWLRGGLIQIGDMFNHDLKARVGAALEDLVKSEPASAPVADLPAESRVRSEHWWPPELGIPTATGGQNAMRYACFPDVHRLVVERLGTVTVYDTGTSTRRLTGFSQAQSHSQSLVFSGPDGRVTLDDLDVVA